MRRRRYGLDGDAASALPAAAFAEVWEGGGGEKQERAGQRRLGRAVHLFHAEAREAHPGPDRVGFLDRGGLHGPEAEGIDGLQPRDRAAGLIQIDGNYYYVNSYCKVITNQRYWVSKTNDLLPAAFYNFDAEGKMTDAPIPTPDPDPNPDPNPEVKNGIVSEDGELYYYVDGVKTYAGLIQIDGDYYYVNSYCKVITSQRYWVSKTNNLLPATFYTFGADGKMVR